MLIQILQQVLDLKMDSLLDLSHWLINNVINKKCIILFNLIDSGDVRIIRCGSPQCATFRV